MDSKLETKPNLVHPKSLYSNLVLSKLEERSPSELRSKDVNIKVTLRTPDNISNLIRYLDYAELRKKILPKRTLFPPKSINIKLPVVFGRRTTIEQALKLACCLDNFWTEMSAINPKLSTKYNRAFLSGVKDVCTTNINNMKWNCNWSHAIGPNEDQFAFNPYLLSNDCVYLIVTSKGERVKLIEELLAHFCLARKLGHKISKIGIIVPGRPSQILKEDLSDWKGEELYWSELEKALLEKRARESLYRTPSYLHTMFRSQLHSYVGRHVFKEDLETHITVCSKRTYQFFITTRSYAITSKPKYEATIKALVEKNQAKIFIHAPYVYNMSKPTEKLKAAIVDLLTLSVNMGVRGVVIHVGKGVGKSVVGKSVVGKSVGGKGVGKSVVGKSVGGKGVGKSVGGKGVGKSVGGKGVGGKDAINEKKAVENMKATVIEVVRKAPANSRLLIETPAKQKGEVLSSVEALSEFWLGLPEDVRAKTGICVDTCHVFSAGYMPIDYLEFMEAKKVPVRLIHYNDSLFTKGCCKDRHAPVGVGYIGFDGMYKTLQWAMKKEIGCVFE